MDFEALNKRQTADLEVFKTVAVDKLYNLQNKPVIKEISFWSALFTSCKNIINKRKEKSTFKISRGDRF